MIHPCRCSAFPTKKSPNPFFFTEALIAFALSSKDCNVWLQLVK